MSDADRRPTWPTFDLDMRLAGGMSPTSLLRSKTDLRDWLASLKLQIDALDRSHDETADLASKVFELSQTLTAAMDYGRLRHEASNHGNRLFELHVR
jgi:hypothetical protein